MFGHLKKYFNRRHSHYKPNLVTLFKPLYLFLLIFGLFPYTIRFPKEENVKIKPDSILVSCFFTLIMISLVGASATTTITDMVSVSITEIKINYIVEQILLVITTIVAYCCTYMYRKTYINVLNEVISIWNDLCKTEAEPILKQFRFAVLFSIGFVVTTVIIQTIFACFSDLGTWTLISYIVPELVPCLVSAFFVTAGLMVVCLLKNINLHCCQLVKANTNVGISLLYVKTKQSRITSNLGQLEIAYTRTMNVKRQINRIFETPILITVIQTFHTLVSEAHILYHALVISREYVPFHICLQIFYMVFHSLKVYFLSLAGTLIKREEEKIGKAVHRMSVENIKTFAEIQNFATAISYQESEMTACGYFALDATFVFNTFGAWVTYLIILIQFDGPVT